MEKSEVRITSTLLSGKPKEESVPVSILITMALTFISVLCWRDPGLFQLLSASPHQVLAELEYWRLLTMIAVHADLSHLAVNAGFVVNLWLFIVWVLWLLDLSGCHADSGFTDHSLVSPHLSASGCADWGIRTRVFDGDFLAGHVFVENGATQKAYSTHHWDHSHSARPDNRTARGQLPDRRHRLGSGNHRCHRLLPIGKKAIPISGGD